MRIIYREENRRADYAYARRLLDRLERDDRLLAARSATHLPDGHRADTLAGPGQRGGVSDPVAAAVTIRVGVAGDDHATRAFGLLFQAIRLLELADSERARALPPAPAAHTEHEWCSSCARIQHMVPRADPDRLAKDFGRHVADKATAAGWCRWCAAWWNEYRTVPPVELVRRRAEGRRITTRDVAAALEGRKAAGL